MYRLKSVVVVVALNFWTVRISLKKIKKKKTASLDRRPLLGKKEEIGKKEEKFNENDNKNSIFVLV